MKCADPVLSYTTTSGKRIFRHFSLSDYMMKFHLHTQVFNCGKCLTCRKRKAYELASRCVLHASIYNQNCFITLTYDETNPDYHNRFDYTDIQKFKKRLRKHCMSKYGKKIEIFNVHEYGKNGKKHWHLIIFNHDFEDKTIYSKKNNIPIYTSEQLYKLWPYGYNTIGDVSTASAMYQAQYMEKDFKNGNVTNSHRSHSKHSGLAKQYFLLNYKQILKLGYIPINGTKMPIPRYFQKLAHKHYSHYYETGNFFDSKDRKALYRPFKQGEENKEIADLYIDFKNQKDIKIKELEEEWNKVIDKYFITQEEPDFIKSNNNMLYDLKNKSLETL